MLNPPYCASCSVSSEQLQHNQINYIDNLQTYTCTSAECTYPSNSNTSHLSQSPNSNTSQSPQENNHPVYQFTNPTECISPCTRGIVQETCNIYNQDTNECDNVLIVQDIMNIDTFKYALKKGIKNASNALFIAEVVSALINEQENTTKQIVKTLMNENIVNILTT
eukprot:315675_1